MHDCLLLSRVLCRSFRARRKKSEIPSLVTQKMLRKRLVDDVIGEEDYMPTKDVGIPIIVRQVIYEAIIIEIVYKYLTSFQWFD